MIKDLVVPPKSEPRRSYVPSNYRAAVMKGITEGLKQPVASLTGKAGNWAQLGGDFILGPGKIIFMATELNTKQLTPDTFTD
ncbi:hypothetical protein FRC02_001938 [Tulasnella sp. 418]|nr:hypothetical protein FRC02_001938 [Tulasnella sp. 418]